MNIIKTLKAMLQVFLMLKEYIGPFIGFGPGRVEIRISGIHA